MNKLNLNIPEISEIDDPTILISINKSIETRNIYDAVRFAWKLSLEEAQKAKIVLAVTQGIVRGVFIVHQWLPATEENFPKFKLLGEETFNPTLRERRFGFIGEPAPEFF